MIARFISSKFALFTSILSCTLGTAALAQTNVGGTISVDTTWNAAGSPYIVTSNLAIEGTDGPDGVTTLTIEPGVEVRVQTNVSIFVGSASGSGDPGAIVADGDNGPGAPAQILFTSDDPAPAPGDWIGITLRLQADSSSVLRNVRIRYASPAGSGRGALRSDSNASGTFTLDNVEFVDSGNFDLYLANGTFDISNCTLESFLYTSKTPAVSWTNNTFDNWGARQSRIDIEDAGAFSQNNTFNGVPDAQIEVLSGGGDILTTDQTWTTAPGPWLLSADLIIEGTDGPDGVTTLTLEPGAELRFNGNRGLLIGSASGSGNEGALIADGNTGPGAPAQILLTSSNGTPSPGAWAGITLRNKAHGSTLLRNVRIDYAAPAGSGRGVIRSDATTDDPISITDVDFSNPNNYDFYLANGVLEVSNCTLQSFLYTSKTPAVTWSNNVFNNWGERQSRVDIEDGDFLSHNNTFNKIPGAQLEVLSGGADVVATDQSWSTAPGIWRPTADLIIEGTDGPDGVTTLTLEPGLELRLSTNRGILVGSSSGLGNEGILIADGDTGPGAPAQILLTSANESPAPGDWSGISLRNKAHPSTILRNVRIDYASPAGTGRGAVRSDASTPDPITISDVTFANSGNFDFYLANGVLEVSNCVLESFFYNSRIPQVTWTNNTFNNWGERVSRIDVDDGESLSHGNTFNAVPDAVIEVSTNAGVPLNLDQSWSSAPGPWVMTGDLVVEGSDGPDGVTTLTLEPGVELRFPASRFLYLGSSSGTGDPGAVIADGDLGPGAPAQIVLTASAASPEPGSWAGVQFRRKAHPSTIFNNVLVEFASPVGAGRGAMRFDSENLDPITVNDVIFSQSGNYDIYLADGAVDVTNCVLESFYYSNGNPEVIWDGNTFEDWGARTSRVSVYEVQEVSEGNTFNPVAGAVLEVISNSSDQLNIDQTWSPAPGPLELTGDLFVIGTDGPDGITTLTLEPGTELRVPSNRSIFVGSTTTSLPPGQLIADGRISVDSFDTVNFTSSSPSPDAGSWEGIDVRRTGKAELYDAQVRFADSALKISLGGELVALDRFTANRANIGLQINSGAIVPASPLQRLSFKGCDVGIQANATDLVLRDSNLDGATFAVENLTPATSCIDATSNWWDAPSGPSGLEPLEGCEVDTPSGSGAAITAGVLFDDFQPNPADDGDSVPPNEDNCPFVGNDSQRDEDLDGVGDACDSNPIIRVSTDPLDEPDYDNIQDAVDAALESGTRILIFPGLNPPYVGSVRVDRGQVFTFVGQQGAAAESTGPVIVDGGLGPAFRIIDTSPLARRPMFFSGLTLRGDQGISAATDTELVDLVFENTTFEALNLTGGQHSARRISMGGDTGIGARVADGASLVLSRTTMRGLTDAGLVVDGAVIATNVVIADGNGADGIRVGMTGSLDADYVTIANNTGVGIDNNQGGSVSVDRSIVFANAGSDLLSVACASVAWSNTETPDCSAFNNNISADPELEVDSSLGPASPCLDHGPDAINFDGTPATDVAGGPRARDHDGDGNAQNDCGAFERENPAPSPGAVLNLRFVNTPLDDTLEWDPVAGAVEYHVYRQDPRTLSFQSFATCRDDLDDLRSDTQLVDEEEPLPGEAFSYLITAEDGLGNEGSLGAGTSAERSNFNPCP